MLLVSCRVFVVVVVHNVVAVVCSFYRVNRAEILLMAICALRSCEIIHCILFQRTPFKANAISICLFTYLHLSGYPKKSTLYYKILLYTKKRVFDL